MIFNTARGYATGPTGLNTGDPIGAILFNDNTSPLATIAAGKLGPTGSTDAYLSFFAGSATLNLNSTGPNGVPYIGVGAHMYPENDALYDLGATGSQFKNIYFSGNLYQDGVVFSGGGGGAAGTTGQFTYNNGGISAGSDKFVYLPTGPTGPGGLATGPNPNPTIQLGSYLVPSTDATYDLGATGIQFKDVFFSGNLYQNGSVFSGGGGGVVGTNGQFTYNSNGTSAGSDKFIYLPTGPTGPGGVATGPNPNPTIQLGAHIVPNQDNVYDLGATGLRFRDLHVGGSTIYLGNSVSIRAANDGTVTLGNANGSVNLISSNGEATLYGRGTTSNAAGSNAGSYDWYKSHIFSRAFSNAPIVIVSMYATNAAALPALGTMIAVADITTTGFNVYTDVQNTKYNWTASACNSP
jgi:hypothetical protein